MRIAIVGPGGVGGLLAALLARSGHTVAVVARDKTALAIRERGLLVDSPLGTFTAHVEVATVPAQLAPADVVLLSVKAWQVPEVAPTLASLLAPGAFVVPLENGVDAADQLVTALGQDRVIGGLCRMLSWTVEPGSVKHVGAAPQITLGAWRTPALGRIDPLASALRSAGMDVQLAADFPAALWEKFLFLASFGGVGAVTRAAAGALRTIPETRRLLADACAEVSSVATANGIALPADVVTKTLAFVDALPADATASLQRDIVAGRPSEIEALSGAVARLGAETGVPVPVHATIHAALLPMERAARASGSSPG